MTPTIRATDADRIRELEDALESIRYQAETDSLEIHRRDMRIHVLEAITVLLFLIAAALAWMLADVVMGGAK